MNQILRPGQRVNGLSSGMPCVVEKFLGGGGQGEVYRSDYGGKPVALKWYFPASATPEQRAALEILVRKGPPTDKFLWPMELTSAPGVNGFGYIMPLRDPNCKGIVDLMKRRCEPTFRALMTAGIELAHSYLQLHAQGLCYRDISFGNAFFDPKTGAIMICDNDNVAVDGKASGVLGTPRFMAPEIVRGEAMPGTQTDLFSLAVLLFYIFIVHHPLEGARESSIKCFDAPAMMKIYGTEPLFIFDPQDQSNRPVPGCHDNAIAFWPIYPQFVRELFVKAFTAGLRDPQNGRVRESEWRSTLVRARDSICYCTKCASENFYDVEAMQGTSAAGICWSCQASLRLPPRIRIGRTVVMLNHDTKLFAHHIDDQKRYDFSQPIAEITRHPANPNIWGLKNLSADKWVSTSPDNINRDVEPGRSVTLAAGIKINFGKSEGEVRMS